MKKIICILLSLMMVLALCACGTEKTTSTETANVQTEEAADSTVYTFTIGTATAEESVNWYLVQTFAELLEKNSNGRIVCNCYPNAQLGSDIACIEEMIAGSVTCYANSVNTLTDYVPDCGIYDLAFDFADVDNARAVLNDEDFLNVMSEKMDAAGLKVFKIMNSRFRVTTSSKPIYSVDDFAGVKIRVQNNANHIALWSAIGANPTPMDFSEVYISLQQGTIEAQENPMDVNVSNKFYEPCKYFVESQHLCHNMGLWFSKVVYDSLPEDLQKVVEDAVVEATDLAMAEVDARYDAYVEQIKGEGCEYITFDADTMAELGELVTDSNDAIRAKLSPEVVAAYDAAKAKHAN